MLDLDAGVGLAEFMLIRLLIAGSGTLLILLPVPELRTLLGLGPFFAAPLIPCGAVGLRSVRDIAVGRRNIPCPALQSKYRSPCTLPSFFPSPP